MVQSGGVVWKNFAAAWLLDDANTLKIQLAETADPITNPNTVTYANDPASIAAAGGSPVLAPIVNFPLT